MLLVTTVQSTFLWCVFSLLLNRRNKNDEPYNIFSNYKFIRKKKCYILSADYEQH